MKKQNICHQCGQEINKKIWLENAIKNAKRDKMPQLAKLLNMLNKKI